jgi:nucleotide-binding universal stress UspA family protein
VILETLKVFYPQGSNLNYYKEKKVMNEFKHILVPLDGSPLAERALSPAITLSQQFDSQIILIRVVDFPDVMATTSAPDAIPNSAMVVARKQACREAELYLKAQEGELREQGVNVKTLLHDALPAENIIDTAIDESVDLIIMSTHGRGGLARWAFGSIADKVVRYGPCPVLLVRENNKYESY